MSGYRLTYKLTMWKPKIHASKFVEIFINTILFIKIIAFSLEFVPLHNKKKLPAITFPKQIITLQSCMVVFHSIFCIYHGPPLYYLHGKKLRK